MSGSPADHAPLLLTPVAAAGLFSLMDCPVPPIVIDRLSTFGAEPASADPAQMRHCLVKAGCIDDRDVTADLAPAAAEMMAVVAEATAVVTIEEAPGIDLTTAFFLQERIVILGGDGDLIALRMMCGDEERKRWLVASLGRAVPCADARPFCLDMTSDRLGQVVEAAIAGDSETVVDVWESVGGPPDLADELATAAGAFSSWGVITAVSTRNGDVASTRAGLSPNGAWLARVCLQDEEYHAQLAWLPPAAVLDVLGGTRTIKLVA